MNRTMKLAGAAALSLFGLAAIGLAGEGGGFGDREPGMRGRHHEGRRGMREGFRDLNLTDEQKAQFKTLREQQREAMRPLMEQRRELREQIRQALEAANPDTARIGQLEVQAHRLDQQLRAEHEKMHAAFLNILTPEQKAKVEQRRQEHEQRREQFTPRRQEREEKQ